MSTSQGPWVSVATICERVLNESDGVLSLIRVVDRITQTATGTEPPREMPPVDLNAWVVVSLKSDGARGRHTIKLRPEKPSGEQLPSMEMPVLFEGEERGAALVLNLRMQLDQEGLYWFDVIHDEANQKVLSRIPLRIIYQPQRMSTS